MKTVIIPVIMNERVANIERIENLELIPQRLCPLVQPDAIYSCSKTNKPIQRLLLRYNFFHCLYNHRSSINCIPVLGRFFNKRPNKNKIRI